MKTSEITIHSLFSLYIAQSSTVPVYTAFDSSRTLGFVTRTEEIQHSTTKRTRRFAFVLECRCSSLRTNSCNSFASSQLKRCLAGVALPHCCQNWLRNESIEIFLKKQAWLISTVSVSAHAEKFKSRLNQPIRSKGWKPKCRYFYWIVNCYYFRLRTKTPLDSVKNSVKTLENNSD